MKTAPQEKGTLYAPRVEYRRDNDKVTFFGLSHVADRAFFTDTRQAMARHPVGFYEEVGLFEGPIVQDKQALAAHLPSPARLYARFAALLGVCSQSVLEYPSNWRRADVTADQLVNMASFESLRELIEAGQKLSFGVSMLELLSEIFGRDEVVRRVSDTLGSESDPLASSMNDLLIGQRNSYAISVMEESGLGSFGIAYGINHLDGIGEWLKSTGYQVHNEEWIPALDLRKNL